ncbi:MAG: ATP synthase F1 subunit delta [Pirellulaceae bacterium]|nr:ATP synthase F1 subunit delta [Pirellulaceae bacterium]
MAEAAQHSTVLDSAQQHLGKVYAKALLGAAERAGLVEQVLDEFQAFQADLLDAVPGLDGLLASPRVAVETKTALLDRALQGRVSETFLNFLKVVVRHRRGDCLRAMLAAAMAQYNERCGCVDVWVTTASELTGEVEMSIADRLESMLGRRINLNVRTDPRVLGGLVVRVGDTVYDGSLIGRLEQWRQTAHQRITQSIRDSSGRFETT